MQAYTNIVGKSKPLDISSFFTDVPDPLDFVLPGLLKGTVGSLVSPGGVGKSWFMLEAATSIATAGIEGGNILNFPGLKPGGVMILGAEDGPEILHHRFHSMGRYYKSAELRKAIVENIKIIPTVGDDINVEDPARQKEIIEAGRGCRLIVLDTIARYHTIDENVAAEVKRVMHALEHIAQATESAVVFLHHASKAAALAGAGDAQQASKGSAVWTDHGRWTSNLVGMTKEDAKEYGKSNDERKNYVRWLISKENYGPPMYDLWYVRGNGGVLRPVHLEKQQKPMRSTGAVANSDEYRSRARGG